MNKLGSILFWLLAPLLGLLLAIPVAVAHVAAHILIDRMRRPDARDRKVPISAPTDQSAMAILRPPWARSFRSPSS
jgi:hypothetical protein